jgi:protein unc-119
MPNTTNTLEMIYDLPQLTPQEMQDMINNPWETKSDTFFFVEDKLVIHNRAEYNYAPL